MSHYNKMLFKIDKNGPVWNGTPCWLWQGSCGAKDGVDTYGHVSIAGKTYLVHRVVYAHFNGEIPEGMQIDHLCMNKICCNPKHLDCVTNLQNNLRAVEARKLEAKGVPLDDKAHVLLGDSRQYYCKRGHLLNKDNLKITLNGKRRCNQCHAMEENQFYHEKMTNLTETTHQLHRQEKNAQQQAYRACLRAEQGLGPVDHSLPTHCAHGHEYTSENTRMKADGRVCKTCHREREKARYQAKKNPHDHSDITKLLDNLLEAQPTWPCSVS